ncbi:Zn(2)-C6 fungal-type DNA-binding domain protein [Niveomyces insectorum RCEF 264]|uniref:Zn(2)-C6 fungal-type DNA-binding domain protein n=1 Tax=Niveomyces insectorum RCEF 264 TaxID=1081102 RepID=A0A167P5J8_9HYPO|nr:Zn(2)-C6 fungal-type DNA-binding domain protein [Niveomyces insectorum RCEF 264]
MNRNRVAAAYGNYGNFSQEEEEERPGFFVPQGGFAQPPLNMDPTDTQYLASQMTGVVTGHATHTTGADDTDMTQAFAAMPSTGTFPASAGHAGTGNNGSHMFFNDSQSMANLPVTPRSRFDTGGAYNYGQEGFLSPAASARQPAAGLAAGGLASVPYTSGPAHPHSVNGWPSRNFGGDDTPGRPVAVAYPGAPGVFHGGVRSADRGTTTPGGAETLRGFYSSQRVCRAEEPFLVQNFSALNTSNVPLGPTFSARNRGPIGAAIPRTGPPASPFQAYDDVNSTLRGIGVNSFDSVAGPPFTDNDGLPGSQLQVDEEAPPDADPFSDQEFLEASLLRNQNPFFAQPMPMSMPAEEQLHTEALRSQGNPGAGFLQPPKPSRLSLFKAETLSQRYTATSDNNSATAELSSPVSTMPSLFSMVHESGANAAAKGYFGAGSASPSVTSSSHHRPVVPRGPWDARNATTKKRVLTSHPLPNEQLRVPNRTPKLHATDSNLYSHSCSHCALSRKKCTKEKPCARCKKPSALFPKCVDGSFDKQNVFYDCLEENLKDKVDSLKSNDAAYANFFASMNGYRRLAEALETLSEYKFMHKNGCAAFFYEQNLHHEPFFSLFYQTSIVLQGRNVLRSSESFAYDDELEAFVLVVRAVSACQALLWFKKWMDKNTMKESIKKGSRRAWNVVAFYAVFLEQTLSFDHTVTSALASDAHARLMEQRCDLVYHLAYNMRYMIDYAFKKSPLPGDLCIAANNVVYIKPELWEHLRYLSVEIQYRHCSDNDSDSGHNARGNPAQSDPVVGDDRGYGQTHAAIPQLLLTSPTQSPEHAAAPAMATSHRRNRQRPGHRDDGQDNLDADNLVAVRAYVTENFVEELSGQLQDVHIASYDATEFLFGYEDNQHHWHMTGNQHSTFGENSNCRGNVDNDNDGAGVVYDLGRNMWNTHFDHNGVDAGRATAGGAPYPYGATHDVASDAGVGVGAALTGDFVDYNCEAIVDGAAPQQNHGFHRRVNKGKNLVKNISNNWLRR